jgi:hypothetical protein
MAVLDLPHDYLEPALMSAVGGGPADLASKAYRKIELALLPLPDDQYISKGRVQER